MELTTSLLFSQSNQVLFVMSKIQILNGTHNLAVLARSNRWLFVMSKIQILNGTHNARFACAYNLKLFVMSKIQILNGTHNSSDIHLSASFVVCDVKDTNFEWNSQRATSTAFFAIRCL